MGSLSLRRQDHRRAAVPIVEAVQRYLASDPKRFHVPGHKGSLGAPPAVRELLGARVFDADLTELPGLDDLHEPSGPIRDAEALLAELKQADHALFLVGGSSAGLLGLMIALVAPGDRVLVHRNCHRAVMAGLILTGANPVYLLPRCHQDWAMDLLVEPEEYVQAAERYPDARLAIMLHPSYYGVVCSLRDAIGKLRYRGVTVIVDEAHGAHFGFHPKLPQSAYTQGADAVVQSAHKSLGALTGGAWLLAREGSVDVHRLRSALRLIQTSSPSYPLLASLDAARAWAYAEGREVWGRVLDCARRLKDLLCGVKGLRVLRDEDVGRWGFSIDPTRLTFTLAPLGWDARRVDEHLRTDFGVFVEMQDGRNLLCILGPGDWWGSPSISRLIEALQSLAHCPQSGMLPDLPCAPPLPKQVLSPREAYFAPSERVPLARAAGRVAAQLITPYPPGTPVLCPGEEITPQHIEYIQGMSARGVRFVGLDEASRLTVVAGT